MIIKCNPGPCHWTGGSFRPQGRVLVTGTTTRIENPEAWSEKKPMKSARLFVGFNVGNEPKWKVDDLVTLVRRVREAQQGPEDASFLTQKGVYTSDRTGQVVEEDGAQVIILKLKKNKKFRAQMIELAETIAKEMEQEAVIVEFQKGGVVQETVGVTA